MGFLERVPIRWRERLDDWRVWMAIAYFGLVFVIVALYVLNAKAAHVEAKAAAEQAAITLRQRTEAETTYRACVASITELSRISQHLGGVNDLAAAVLENTGRALNATPRTDPLYPVRAGNFERLENAVADIAAIDRLHVPTIRECAGRRAAILRS